MASGTTAQQTIDVVTPAAGESVTEGTILEWHVKVGDSIALDATIVEISTDKVDVELPSPASGTVSEILVEEGDTVTVGQVIARIVIGGVDADGAADRDGAPEAEVAEAAAHTEATGNGGGGDAPVASEPDAPEQASEIVDVVTPAAGESVTEGTILEWRVEVGGSIKLDETIVEISTDKVDLALPSRATAGARGRAPETGPRARPQQARALSRARRPRARGSHPWRRARRPPR